VAEPPVTFADLLRRLRIEAGLTQEGLAEAAELSPRAISDLERGVNVTARKQTARLLADALGLAGTIRTQFEAVARGQTRPAPSAIPVSAVDWRMSALGTTALGTTALGTTALGTTAAGATRTLPRDIASFTGRQHELQQLVDAAPGGGIVGIHAIGGMAGIGKTAFAVHAAHRLAPHFPGGQIFLPLHGHTAGQRPVSPADALANLLLTAGVAAAEIPPGLEARMALWRDRLADKQLLLVLDDAADSDQVRPLLPGGAGNMVLVTSRRHLTALEDAQAISLDTLPVDEASALLITLANRPGLSRDDVAVADIAELCGYLPLAVGMLARQLHHHPAWTAADLAAELTAARDRLELMATENLSVATAFDLSYQDLAEDQRRVFRRLGLHPGIDIDAYGLAALNGTEPRAARHQLEALYDHYLLTEPARGRYRPHDLIHEYARALVADDDIAESEAAVARLLDYYLHTSRSAARHLARRTSVMRSDVTQSPPPGHAPDLSSWESAAAWMQTERLNLHAAVMYAADHRLPRHAADIAAAMHNFLRNHGHWGQALTLHEAALKAARTGGDQLAEAEVLIDLGAMQTITDDYPGAIASLRLALNLYRGVGQPLGEANALTDLGIVQRMSGDHAGAAVPLRQALELYRDLGDRLGEARSLTDLGVAQNLLAELPAAAASLTRALELYRGLGNRNGQINALNYLGAVQRDAGDYHNAAASQREALALSRALGSLHGQANALTALGATQSLDGDHRAAIASLEQSLELCRRLGHARSEAVALGYLGAAQLAGQDHPAAGASLSRALELFRRIGDRAAQAEILNLLGDLALASADPARARSRHEEALALAVEVASPFDQAHALEGIGRCHLRDGRGDQATEFLRKALEIYQRIESPHAQHVEELIRGHS
jgi:tetratricopeptide (TPR) repeat protein/DNA-binding XRE family transcriptional regulator